MSSSRDRWKSPAWGFQSKPDARLDLLGISSVFGSGEGYLGPATGNIYYVADEGSTSNTGLTPDSPLLTITAALAKVTDGNNDAIVVMSYGATSAAAETWPIALTTSHDNLTIMGVPYGNIGSNSIYKRGSGNTVSSFTVVGTYQLRFINLNIGADGASYYGISYPSGTAWRNSILGCHFGTSGTASWGINIASDPPQLLVEGCDFHSGLSEGGIYVSNCTRGDFLDNSFHVNTGDRGIQFSTSQADFGKIMGNTFFVMDAANGEAVYCSGQMAGGIEVLAGNVAVKQGPTSSPYTFIYEPYWWGGSTAPGVGYGPNVPDPVEPYARYVASIWPEHGKLIFVNGGSDGPTDNNLDGTTPRMCKQTLTAALALVTADNYDVIVVLNYGSNARAVDFASGPLTLTSSHSRVRFLGVDGDSTKWPTITVGATSSNHAFEIQTGAGRIHFRNLEIGGAAAKAGIHVSVGQAPWGVVVDNCHFGVDTTVGLSGILIDSGGDMPHLRVRNCLFNKVLTGAQISAAGVATGAHIENNTFNTAASQIAIKLSGDYMVIKDNVMRVTDATGTAITLTSSTNSLIAGNKAHVDNVAAITNVVWADDSASDAWVDNQTGDNTSLATMYELPA